MTTLTAATMATNQGLTHLDVQSNPGPDAIPAVAYPCAKNPHSGLFHLGQPCGCFFGGPQPEFLH